MNSGEQGRAFPFRPWVRNSCRRAAAWSVGLVAIFAAAVWALGLRPGGAAWGRAFAVLAAYGALFAATLAKIWWSAGRPAVVVDGAGIAYQPLHTFRPRRVGWEDVLAAAPRPGTESYRLTIRTRGGAVRELFLNLGVVKGKHELLDLLGAELAARGLAPVAGVPGAWCRPGWEEVVTGFGAQPGG